MKKISPKQVFKDFTQTISKGKDGKQIKEFAGIYFRNVPERELKHYSSGSLEGHVKNVFGGFKNLKENEIKLKVFNPDYTPHSVVEIYMKDRPFLVDTIWVEFQRREMEFHHTFHPVISVKRDKKGVLKEFKDLNGGEKGFVNESIIHIEFDRQDDAKILAEIEKSCAIALEKAISATDDFPPMMENMNDIISKLKSGKTNSKHKEEIAYLEWLSNNNFIFLGYRHYDIKHTGKEPTMGLTKGASLGILQNEKESSVYIPKKVKGLAPNIGYYIGNKNLLVLTKALMKSPVHRYVDMEYVGVKEFNKAGKVIGEHRFVGLLTSNAYTSDVTTIPLVRKKIKAVLAKYDKLSPHTHNVKILANILSMYPRDELFQINEADLYRISTGILNLKERLQTRAFIRHSPHERLVTVTVFIPRDRMNSILREKIMQIVMDVYDGEDIEYKTTLGDSQLARVFLKVRSKTPEIPEVDDEVLEKLIIDTTKSWNDSLKVELEKVYSNTQARALFNKYHNGFRAGYRDHVLTNNAVKDIAALEEVADGKNFLVTINKGLANEAHLKVFHKGEKLNLSDIMPLFDNMDLDVVEEFPSLVKGSLKENVWIHDFSIKLKPGQESMTDCETVAVLKAAIEKAWYGELENDNLNSIMVTSAMPVQKLIVLRAMIAYMQQTGSRYSRQYMRATLVKHPAIAKMLAELFEARFKLKSSQVKRNEEQEVIVEKIKTALADVSVLDEDIIIRNLRDLILATRRTNVYQNNSDTDPLAFKIKSSEVPELIKPHPLFEIFVYHSRVEGVHLRGGMVARGGLRWSDRPADYRTEVLGLMKTQMTKNAVIVPVGSKGGFVLKTPPCDLKNMASCNRDDLFNAVKGAYTTFISSLLSVTDNIVGGKVIAPNKVVRYDSDDPYLVVAADKGTATFSDTANSIAIEADYWTGAKHGFWLGDAFASGGSNGYDHKKMGITAKGAWECVKHHFRTLGKDIQREDFTVAAVGDMAGDVFGNGMLLSKHIKLQAAFNHMHIFIDPNPDAAASWKERSRMFKTPRIMWSDYNNKLLSKGGKIYDRKAKKIILSAEAQKMLGLEETTLTPDELITAILKMKVDLLWNGGIGTFIKAKNESHQDVGDRANDNVRINAEEVGATVIGEGGNLGLTQLARVEYAENGGIINTDAIDNSAGVDCSDHEVNIKILLNMAEEKGKLSTKERNKLLTAMTNNVSKLTLVDNYQQAQILSIAEEASKSSIDTYRRLIHNLENKGLLDSRIEFLPDEEEFEKRRSLGLGLTRPELSVLLSYSKFDLFEGLIDSKLPDDPALDSYLVNYFPEQLQNRYKQLMHEHRLKREIVATVATNELINRMGITFIDRMRDETGSMECTLARSFIAAKTIFKADDLWNEIDSFDNKLSSEAQFAMFKEVKKLVESVSFWFLQNQKHGPLDITTSISRYQKCVDEVVKKMGNHLTPALEDHYNVRLQSWLNFGLSKELAKKYAIMPTLHCAMDIAEVILESKQSADDVIAMYFMVGNHLQMGLMHNKARSIRVKDNWQRVASLAIIADLYQNQKLHQPKLFHLKKAAKPKSRL